MDNRSARRYDQLRAQLSAVLRLNRLRAAGTRADRGRLRRVQKRMLRRTTRQGRAAQRQTNPRQQNLVARVRAADYRLSLRPPRTAPLLPCVLGVLHDARAGRAAHRFGGAGPRLRRMRPRRRVLGIRPQAMGHRGGLAAGRGGGWPREQHGRRSARPRARANNREQRPAASADARGYRGGASRSRAAPRRDASRRRYAASDRQPRLRDALRPEKSPIVPRTRSTPPPPSPERELKSASSMVRLLRQRGHASPARPRNKCWYSDVVCYRLPR